MESTLKNGKFILRISNSDLRPWSFSKKRNVCSFSSQNKESWNPCSKAHKTNSKQHTIQWIIEGYPNIHYVPQVLDGPVSLWNFS